MKPGLEPDQAQAQPGPLLRVRLDIWQAQARPSPAQARALSPSQARHITRYEEDIVAGDATISVGELCPAVVCTTSNCATSECPAAYARGN